MKCDSWASLLAHTFTSPHFGCEPKIRAVTTIVSKPVEGSERFDKKQDEPINLIVD
jgi:hypothetical protein